ncbi:PLP-dependent aminotransferase family protein [Bacillus sp. B1-b2]|uniref:MocR-like pyridoxine biosynthesis transcription factor PdxR n=1 Tax=Bacillus sp. B1-b2 TaxID=2653201 RepID=UPI0012625606|nr:PLP-dependent aminotransferase family protein [Bacillus sp. B1-b2]KAB7671096.1 PLP-dependent aminotransferase family protein [Bacillus sp. B1-b2]
MNIAIHIRKESKTPVYLQLYEYFQDEIIKGKMPAGTKLPSIRYLANYLHISKNTVIDAYQQLWMEGYVESKEKSGYRVVSLSSFDYHSNKMETNNVIVPKEEEHFIDFHYGKIDQPHFPSNAWKKALKEAIETEGNWMLYGDYKGESILRNELAGYLSRSRGISVSPENILISAGTEQLIMHVLGLLNRTSLQIAMEEPGYDGVREVFRKEGHTVHPVPVLQEEGYQLSSLLSSNSNLVYVTPSHQFPLGNIMPINQRIELLKWAEQADGYILEDDYDSEFRFLGSPIPSMKSIDRQDRVIYLGTFSKCFLPSVRISYMILPTILMEKWNTRQFEETQSSSPLLQKAVAAFMKSGEFEKHIKRMRKVYERKYHLLMECIRRYMGNKVTIIGESAGVHVLISVEKVPIDKLIQKAEKVGVRIYSTEKYYKQEAKCFPIILGFGGLNEEEIEVGIKRLSNCWFNEEG